MQNAKDVAGEGGVEIISKLTNEQLEFTHNGIPFVNNLDQSVPLIPE